MKKVLLSLAILLYSPRFLWAEEKIDNMIKNTKKDDLKSWGDVVDKVLWDGYGWILIVMFGLTVISFVIELVSSALGKAQIASLAKMTSYFLCLLMFLSVLIMLVKEALGLVLGW